MIMDNLPIIDWESGAKLAGNNKELAKELLCLLTKSLPDDISAIKQLHSLEQYPALLQRVHKLHGAVSYCGLPRLKTVLNRLEIELKNKTFSHLSAILNQLDVEFNLFLEKHFHLEHS